MKTKRPNKIDGFHDLPIPADARGMYDPHKTREWVNEYALHSFNAALNKIETNDLKLRVKDVHFKEPGKSFSFTEQKDAILNKKDLTLPIRGTFELIDKKTGHVIDTKTTTIAHLPWITDRNTTILNGSEYVTTNQQRLKPGVYVRQKENSEIEAHINVLSGSGVGGHILFDPTKAIFFYEVGTTQIKLYGLLKDLGISDSAIEQEWGKEIYLKNKMQYDGMEIDKFHNKVFTNKYDTVKPVQPTT